MHVRYHDDVQGSVHKYTPAQTRKGRAANWTQTSASRLLVLRFRQIDVPRHDRAGRALAAGGDATAPTPTLGLSSRHSEGVSMMRHDNVAEGLVDVHCRLCGRLDEEPLRQCAARTSRLLPPSAPGGSIPTRRERASRTH